MPLRIEPGQKEECRNNVENHILRAKKNNIRPALPSRPSCGTFPEGPFIPWCTMTKAYISRIAFCCALSLAMLSVCTLAQASSDTRPFGWWHARTAVAAGHPTELTSDAQTGQNRNAAAPSGAEARPTSDRPDRQMGTATTSDRQTGMQRQRGEANAPPSGAPSGHPDAATGMQRQGQGENAATPPAQTSSGYPGAGAGMQGQRNSAGVAANAPGATPAQSAPASMRDRRLTRPFYLSVSEGAEAPTEAPEVYYRFTTRTMERHGGVPIASKIYEAKVVREGKTWRADIFSPDFGSVEIFSRFMIGDTRVYAQHNYLHFVAASRNRDNAPQTPPPPMPPETTLPEDWPLIEFPTSNYNAMPLRTLRIGEDAMFTVKRAAGQSTPGAAFAHEDNFTTPLALPQNARTQTFTYAPRPDDILENAARRVAKNAVLTVTFPDSDEVATFCLSISRSKWSGLDLNSGLFLLFGSAVLTIAIVLYRRRRFKYYDRN